MNDRPTILDVDGDLDRVLRSAGSRWRATRMPSDAAVDASLFYEHRRSAWVPVLASVVGLLVLLVAGIFISASLPTVTSSPTPSPTPSVTPSMTIVDDMRWTQSQIGFDGYIWVPGVQAVDGWFLAGGAGCVTPGVSPLECGDGDSRAVLLQSRDGQSWTVAAQMDTGRDEALAMSFLRTDQFGILAGTRSWHDQAGAGLWRSTDGTSWEWLGGQTAFAAPDCGTASRTVAIAELHSIAAGVIALGRTRCSDAFVNAAWFSADGSQWQRLDDQVPMTGITEGHGLYVGTTDDAIWRSQDGLEWTKTAETELPVAVVPVESGFVAVGSNPLVPNHLLMWSADGLTWNRFKDVLLTHDLFGGPSSDGRRAIVLEDVDQVMNQFYWAVWTSSPDGMQWTGYRQPLTRDVPRTAAIWGNRVVALGGSGTVYTADIPD
jgi:hypothetical protein